MNVLFVTRSYSPNIGGVESHIKGLTEELLKKGHKVKVLTKKTPGLKERETINGAKVLRFSYPEVRFLGLVGIWFWVITNLRLFKKADVIHFHDVTIWGLPLKLFTSKRIFSTFHGWRGIHPIPLKDKLIRKVESLLSTKTIGVGKRIEKHYGIKCDVITYGAVKVPRDQRTKRKKSIVYVGSLEKDRGLEATLEVFSSLRGYKIDFCGDGELSEECRKHGEVHGFVDPKPFLARAEYCFCSGYLSMLEGFANKCTVVSSYNNSTRRDILELTPFANWVVFGGTANSILKKLKRREESVNEAYNWVSTQTWSRLTKDYLNIWQ